MFSDSEIPVRACTQQQRPVEEAATLKKSKNKHVNFRITQTNSEPEIRQTYEHDIADKNTHKSHRENER
jgi:hypothetical protein